MKKFFLSVLGIAAFLPASAQLYVSPASYVYVSDRYLYVRQNVNLQANSNLYLRNGSQLLQGTTAAGTNSGAGNLSVFQEGSVDNFEYNYWCSPVGNASAAVGNENFGVTQLSAPATVTSSVPAILLPNSGFDGSASPLTIAPRWVFKYTTSTNYSDWVHVGSASNLGAGQGFTMKGTSGSDATTVQGVANNPGSAQRYDFRGKPNDGNIPVTVAAGLWTLTGNPYPSAIDLQMFLVSETNCTGTAYFWEQDKTVNSHLIMAYQGGYGSYSGATGIYLPATFQTFTGSGVPLANIGSGLPYARRFSPVGQGFMIEGSTNGTVTMRNQYRVFVKENAVSSVFERMNNASESEDLSDIPSVSGYDYASENAMVTPHIRFNLQLNNIGIRQLALAFRPDATDGFDHAMDSKSPSDAVPADGYFPMESKEYVLSTMQFDMNKRIPIAFKNTDQATFLITVAEMVNFTESNHVYLFDRQTGIYHEINGEEYEWSLPAGNSGDRFEITFTNESTLGVKDHDINSLTIVQDNSKELLTVFNPGLIDVDEVLVFDIGGKKVLEKRNVGAEASVVFPTSSLSEAVYIVKVVSKNASDKSSKIIVSHQNR